MKKELRFYTNPPIDYPYFLKNIHQKTKPSIHEIIDIGINDLLKPPHTHTDKKLQKWHDIKLGTNGDNIGWKIVPDCPDIFKEFDIPIQLKKFDNVKYSKELLIEYYDKDNDTHVPVIQGYYDDKQSFIDYLDWFLDNYPIPDKIAVGTMCKSADKLFVKRTLRHIRNKLPNTWIHAFGLRLYHLPNVYMYINSWDSMSWTFPRTGGLPSAKNKKMRIDYFHKYLKTIPRLTNYHYILDGFELIYNNTSLTDFFD